ncbi:tRNA sulfurtransferase ThiI [Nosocomiicoccus sp. HMSC067E10]|uniref:tRNA uracil 4-sulfurtransferase ThiI n=1 Tax=Nosocomiicoccus sp. HMSC067E10 TaxID=1739271 RepID=UPI0008A17A35|nr:tRNA sulfurtransferase ThiI [Nosocomiicoccus sp. HMSC067E10]
MKYDLLLVRYGELTLKKKNRKMFIGKLVSQIERALEGLDIVIRANRDRMYIDLENEDAYEVINRLKHVNGILSMSPIIRLEKTDEAMKENALLLESTFKEGDTFKVEVKRIDKAYHLKTHEIQQLIGGYVVKETNRSVNIKHPDHTIMIEIRYDGIYMYSEVYDGVGGLPLGTGGKTVLMLSGGIDSPVAGFEIMRRGVEIEAIHFFSPPYTSEQSLEKVKTLVDIMADKTGVDIKMHIVPFTNIQTTIYDKIPDGYSMTTTRRIMLIIAERLARKIGAEAVVNGENIGQVASQTLTSMNTINAVTNFPVLRPLLTYEKNEIIQKAVNYGTYETSILPFEDCCTIFKPKQPKTSPNLDKVIKYESNVDFEPLIEDALNQITTYTSKNEQESTEFEDLL